MSILFLFINYFILHFGNWIQVYSKWQKISVNSSSSNITINTLQGWGFTFKKFYNKVTVFFFIIIIIFYKV